MKRLTRKLLPLLALTPLIGSILSVTALAAETEADAVQPVMYGTWWALVPPLIAIVLALITKEAYSSLFLGVVVGALFASDFAPLSAMDMLIEDGLMAAISDNAGIFIFLVLLGTVVALVNRRAEVPRLDAGRRPISAAASARRLPRLFSAS